jgi:outer membrane protein assembly factor BamB
LTQRQRRNNGRAPEGVLRWSNPEIVDRTPRYHRIVFSAGQADINHRIAPQPGEWLMAFRMSDGEMQWQRPAETSSQPLIGPGGRIYVDDLLGVWYTRIYDPDGGLHLNQQRNLAMRTFSPDLSKIYSSRNSVSAFDSKTLSHLWSADTGVPHRPADS